MVSIEKVKQLRDQTGISLGACKKALEEASDDLDKALEILRSRDAEVAAKKKDRDTGEGLVVSYIHGQKAGVLLDIRSETDFVAKSDGFKELARDVAMQIAAMDPESVEELLSQSHIKDESKTIEEVINSRVAEFGENIKVERFTRYEI